MATDESGRYCLMKASWRACDSNAKKVYKVMHDNHLLLERKGVPERQRRHNLRIEVAKSNLRWCSDDVKFNCDDGNKLCITFVLDFVTVKRWGE